MIIVMFAVQRNVCRTIITNCICEQRGDSGTRLSFEDTNSYFPNRLTVISIYQSIDQLDHAESRTGTSLSTNKFSALAQPSAKTLRRHQLQLFTARNHLQPQRQRPAAADLALSRSCSI